MRGRPPPPPAPNKSQSFSHVIDPSLHPRLMLPYEEHLRAGGAEFKIPESPSLPKARGIRGRKPHPRGRKPGAKAKEKRITTPASSPSAVCVCLSVTTSLRAPLLPRHHGLVFRGATAVGNRKLPLGSKCSACTSDLSPDISVIEAVNKPWTVYYLVRKRQSLCLQGPTDVQL